MKNNKIIIITAVAFVAVIALAAVGYDKLSAKYTPTEQMTDIAPEKTQAPQEKQEPTVRKAPDFTVYDREGETVKFSDFSGKPMVINFWATWCGPCRSELPAFENMYEKYSDKAEIMMVNMTDGDRETNEIVEAFLSDKGYSFPVYMDSDYSAAIAYGVRSLPLTVFIDAEGNLLGGHPGAMSEETLEKYFSILLEE